jgi:DNA-binding HxlR family transcriptional regulator
MLTQTLRMLERDGMVTRTITASVPVRVDYQLTPLGYTLLPVVRAIKHWSETHIAEVHAARVSALTTGPPGLPSRRPPRATCLPR